MFAKCLYFNTAALARVLEREWSSAFEPFGLTPPQAFMLRAVLDAPGRSLAELSSDMVVSRPTTTRALDGLEKRGLVERVPSARDGRELSVCPTAAGKALHADLNRASATVTSRLRHLLGDHGFTSAVTTVRSVRERLE